MYLVKISLLSVINITGIFIISEKKSGCHLLKKEINLFFNSYFMAILNIFSVTNGQNHSYHNTSLLDSLSNIFFCNKQPE